MTDTEIFDFCEEHDIEVSFRFENLPSTEPALASRSISSHNSRLISQFSQRLCSHPILLSDLPMLYASKALYEIPSNHQVTIDYNKMAKALYDAGYRKGGSQ